MIRARVTSLYLQRLDIDAISEQISKPTTFVRQALRDIREAWRDRAILDYSRRQAEELARIDVVEEEAWSGWRRSQEAERTERTHLGEDEAGRSFSQTTTRDGTTKFLEVIQWCVEQRCKIIGLYAPKELRVEQHQSSDSDGVAEMNRDELTAILSAASQRLAHRHAKATAVDADFEEHGPGELVPVEAD